VRTSFEQSPRWSAVHHSKKLGLSESSVRCILHLDLHFRLYKIQVVQKLEEGDAAKRLVFSQQMLDLINRNKEVLNNLIMSDEAHFHLTGLGNKQNCRYWSDRHPRELVQKPLHSSKLTVCCAVAFFTIMSPYFFEDERGNACTVTSEHYAHMLQDFFIYCLQGLPMNKNTYFQQDGAASHTAKIAMNILRPLFPGYLISRYGDIAWPARSPDLSVCDFYLLGYLKRVVYCAPSPRPTQKLKEEISRIPANVLRRAVCSQLTC
jgi:hypothetical protein